jgi:hypothetical protein
MINDLRAEPPDASFPYGREPTNQHRPRVRLDIVFASDDTGSRR